MTLINCLRGLFLGAVALPCLAGMSRAATPFLAEAEVSVSSGPIKLTLSVYRTHLKLIRGNESKIETDWKAFERDHPHYDPTTFDFSPEVMKPYDHLKLIDVAEPIWIRLRITNVGKSPLAAWEPIFTGSKNVMDALTEDIKAQFGIFVTLVGPDGQPVRWDSYKGLEGCPEGIEEHMPHSVPENEMSAGQLKEHRQAQEQLKKWKAAGYSREKMQKLLDQWLGKRSSNEFAEWQKKKDEKDRREHPTIILKPGESAATPPFVSPGVCPSDRALLPPQIGDFAELWNFHLHDAGSYKIRAVYDMSPTDFDIRWSQEHKKPIPADQVRVQTPWIHVKVAP